jgi:hypothetical protein
VAILALAALVAICCTCAYWWSQLRQSKQQYRERERIRQHQLAIQEQQTIQVDAAKGNPEMLRMVRDMQRTQH